MNQVNFDKIKAQSPNWIASNVVSIPMDKIEVPETSSQIRNQGIIPSHVMTLAEDMDLRGQQVPITLEPNPEKEGYYFIVDGNHRFKGGKDRGWTHINAYVMSFPSLVAKVSYQVMQNSHLPSKENSNDDILDALELLNNDPSTPAAIDRALFNTAVVPQTWEEGAVTYIKNFFGVGTKKAKATIAKFMAGFTNLKVKSFMKSEVTEVFNRNNTIGWSGGTVGNESNGWVYYPISKASHIFPNITGNGFKKKTDKGSHEIAVVVSLDGMSGKDGKDLDSARRAIISNINKANTSGLLKSSKKLVDKVYLMPQKLDPTHLEHTDTLYEVPSSGRKFSLNLPKRGWDSQGVAK
tara:strand:- start:137 stop:1189 length:1053 start_codon:yes stop_codon:yes gene_type:complete